MEHLVANRVEFFERKLLVLAFGFLKQQDIYVFVDQEIDDSISSGSNRVDVPRRNPHSLYLSVISGSLICPRFRYLPETSIRVVFVYGRPLRRLPLSGLHGGPVR
jgi:hypothetical protein